MTGFEVYKMYLALKNHFTRDNYDYQKYNGKVSASEKAFEQRRDRFFFKKLATKYSQKDVLGYFVANFIKDPKGYIGSFSREVYTQWKIHQESFTYKFKQDVNLFLEETDNNFDHIFLSKGQHPPLLKRYYAGEVDLETLVVFEHCLGYSDNLDKVIKDPIWNDTKKRIKKYQPFLDIDCQKYKTVILETIKVKL